MEFLENTEHLAEMVAEALGGSKIILETSTRPAVPNGEHYMSTILRMAVKYKSNSKDDYVHETTMIIKTYPPGPLRNFVSEHGMLMKELKMYNTVIPYMSEIIGTYITPKCLFSNDEIMFMEDLRLDNFKTGNRVYGLDYEHCVSAMKLIADFHGSSYLLNSKHPDIIDFVRKEVHYCKENQVQKNFVDNCFTILAEELKTWSGFETFSSHLLSIRDDIWDKSCKEIAEQKDGIMVLNHGDFWTNNILFRYDNNNIVEAKAVDFQFCRWTSPAIDLQIFFTLSLRERKFISPLIDVYVSKFNDYIRPNCVSRGELLSALRRSDCFGFLLSVCILPLILLDPSKAVNMEEIDPEMADHGENSNSLGIIACKDETFKNVFPRHLEYYKNIGLL